MSEDSAALAFLAGGLIAGLLIVIGGLVLALRHPQSGKTVITVKKSELKITTEHTGIALVSIGLVVLLVTGTLLYFRARRSEYRSAVLRKTVSSLSSELAKQGNSIIVSGMLNREKATAVKPATWSLSLDNPVTVAGEDVKKFELPVGDRRLFSDLEGERVDVVGVPLRFASPEGGLRAAIVPARVQLERMTPAGAVTAPARTP